jgi:hypothetical protein
MPFARLSAALWNTHQVRSIHVSSDYQATWVSKQRAEHLRRIGVGRGILLESFNGFLVVEAVGSKLGDGLVLSHQEADYELQAVWCTGPKAKLTEARRLLGLDREVRQRAG